MKRAFSLLPAVLIASLLTASVAIAHHSFAMFDRSVEKVVTGTVVRWTFNTPHSWLYLNVKNTDGSETLWSFEGSAPPSLLQRGITGSTFEPGNTVTISYCPLKDGRPGGGLGWVRLANGTFVNPGRRRLQRQRQGDRDAGRAGSRPATPRAPTHRSRGRVVFLTAIAEPMNRRDSAV